MAQILLVDNEDNLLHSMSRTLNGAGHEVITARNGREALVKFFNSSLDLVICDLMMPGKDGLEVLRDLKKTDPDVRFIAMSGSYIRDRLIPILQVAKQLGAAATLEKPFTPEQLLDTVAEVLGQTTRTAER
jgi:CheY-like chemotaxis protein